MTSSTTDLQTYTATVSYLYYDPDITSRVTLVTEALVWRSLLVEVYKIKFRS